MTEKELKKLAKLWRKIESSDSKRIAASNRLDEAREAVKLARVEYLEEAGWVVG